MASQPQSRPRLLLVEDDPISSGFLRIALEALPAEVDCCDSLAAALRLATERRYDLALIDARLPDGNGADLLDAMRRADLQLPALAHTAELSPGTRHTLYAAGFIDVLVKPISADRLRQAVRSSLTQERITTQDAAQAQQDWDEHAAMLALNGQRGHLNALRALFLTELPATGEAIESALRTGDIPELRNHLHRLQASCGFVGAARLAAAVRRLRDAPQSPERREQFRKAITALLQP